MNDAKSTIHIVLQIIYIATIFQTVHSIINGEMDIWIALSIVTAVLTGILLLMHIYEKQKDKETLTDSDENHCKKYVVIISAIFTILLSYFTYMNIINFQTDGLAIFLKVLIPSVLYLFAFLPIKFKYPFLSKKYASVPNMVLIGIAIELYIVMIISNIITKTTGWFELIVGGPFVIAYLFAVPIIISLFWEIVLL